MGQENEIQELKDRLNSVEKQLEKRSKSSQWIKTGVIIILGIFLLLFLIGVIQFISTG